MLGRDEREAVLGDLIEAGDGAWSAMIAVLGLVVRREAGAWKSWRPWVAVFGLSVPCSFLLMGASVSVCQAFQHILAAGGHPLGSSWLAIVPQALLLVGCSWTGGFVVGSLSRRTLWFSTLSCLLPCLFCISRFHIESLSPLCLLIFLLPGMRGASDALRIGHMKSGSAMLLAHAMTLLAVTTLHHHGEPWWNPPRYMSAFALLWPAWYMVAISTKTERRIAHEEMR